jgi:hypothetical protein
LDACFDKFSAVDGGDQKLRGLSRKASDFVHWAAETALENWPVNFAHIGSRGFVFHANNDAIGMKTILDSGAFAKELRVGDDAKGHAAIARIRVQRAAQLQAGASGNGAFLDDEFRGTRLGGDLAGDVIDGGKIRVTVFFRGVPTQMKMASLARIASPASVVYEILPDLRTDSRTASR